uniref:Polyprenal reductase n=1 Tax=Megaselia scalaris TaxID=36166 RepID=T1GBQ6_MEGSC
MLALIESLHINLVDFMFINFSMMIVFAGALMNFLEPHLPQFITQSFRYGKHESKGEKNPLVCLLEVPKSWFKHFYVFALGWSALALYLTVKGIIFRTSAPEFVLRTHGQDFSFRNLRMGQIICCILFHLVWREQYKSNMIFVNLRKDKSGKQVTEDHLIPSGRLFHLITSPHFLCEILMYVLIFCIIPQSSSWMYCTIW